MFIVSDYLKAILYTGNLMECRYDSNQWTVAKEKCLTIQHFTYKCQRNVMMQASPMEGLPRRNLSLPSDSAIPTTVRYSTSSLVRTSSSSSLLFSTPPLKKVIA